MIKSEPLVSIITPAYNSGKFIGKTIDSVIGQSYSNWELIIVDDCSIDNTFEIILGYSNKDKRIRIIKLPSNSGHPSIPRNVGIKSSNGKYISFLDSDDYWLHNKLKVQVNYMEERQLMFSHMNYFFCDEHGKLFEREFIVRPEMNYIDLVKFNGIGCLTVMYNCEILGKQYFIPNVAQEDFIYWLEICNKLNRVSGIQEAHSVYRIRGNSVSSNKFKMAIGNWSIYYNYLGFNLIKSIYFFSCFSINWIYKRLKL